MSNEIHRCQMFQESSSAPDRAPADAVDDNPLAALLATRFGYGNPAAQLWFLGLEESMSGGEEDFHKRLDVWAKRNRPAWDDARGYHQALGDAVFMPHPTDPDRSRKSQPTWSFLAKILARYRGNEAMRRGAFLHWSIDGFGSTGSDHALAELLPLPKPQAGSLPEFYGRLGRSDLDCLPTYRKNWLNRRARALSGLLPRDKRCAVIVYVTNAHRPAIVEVLNENLQMEIDAGFRGTVKSLTREHAWRTAGRLAVCFSSFAGQGQMTNVQASRIGAEAQDWVTKGRAPP